MILRTVAGPRFKTPQLLKSLDFATGIVSVTSVAAQNNLTTQSICCWFFAIGAGSRLYAKGNGIDGRIQIRKATSGRFTFTAGYGGTLGQWTTEAWGYKPGCWNHLIITYTYGSLTNDPSMYVNNRLMVQSEITPTGSSPSDDTNLYIGNRSGGASAWGGLLSDFQIYNKILSANERSDIYYKGKTTSGLVGHWKLDEGSGTTAIDSTGNANGVNSGAVYSNSVPFPGRTPA